MTDVHKIVEGRIICGLCDEPVRSWVSLPQFEWHLACVHGAPIGLVFTGEVATSGWPEPAMPAEPDAMVDALVALVDGWATQVQDRDAAARDRELWLAAFSAAAQATPREWDNAAHIAAKIDALAVAIYERLRGWIGDTP